MPSAPLWSISRLRAPDMPNVPPTGTESLRS
jgi:hypothetical protein